MKSTSFAHIGKMLAVTLTLAGLSPAGARAEIRLPGVFGSHMVLQQDLPLTIWGWAQPEETVTVQFLTESKQVKANDR
ncbi:MAG TPA: sialate O-acetylesterase, partial [Phycisphaerae bacterium]|nr:sialate O-acetylesterase [Phycisphaerae bacterium]